MTPHDERILRKREKGGVSMFFLVLLSLGKLSSQFWIRVHNVLIQHEYTQRYAFFLSLEPHKSSKENFALFKATAADFPYLIQLSNNNIRVSPNTHIGLLYGPEYW